MADWGKPVKIRVAMSPHTAAKLSRELAEIVEDYPYGDPERFGVHTAKHPNQLPTNRKASPGQPTG